MSKGTRLDPGWELPADWQIWAMTGDRGLSMSKVELEAQKFRDYWIAKTGQAATKLDWFATWRNWIRKAVADQPKPERAPAREVADISTPYRSSRYNSIAREHLDAMRRRVR